MVMGGGGGERSCSFPFVDCNIFRGIVKSVAMSKNSNRIITCGQDRNLLMYRLDRIGQNSPEEFEGPEVGSRHVIYGSTEREIYVASEDGGLTLTDLRTG